MRVIVFFDLPVTTSMHRRNYTKFRKFLLSEGFIMMQESVYSKILLNYSAVDAIVKRVSKFRPPSGLVQLLVITEKQYNSITVITGETKSEIISTDERVVIL